MKIGILTYFNAFNFGANLQAFSTYNYFLNHGYDPIFIDYRPDDYNLSYSRFPEDQKMQHLSLTDSLQKTDRCADSIAVANVLKKNGINNVVIGSDAVAQHHPFISQIVFPSRHIISLSRPTSDRMFPNAYWGEFLDYYNDVNVCLMSVSSQQSDFKHFSQASRHAMNDSISRFNYISVRDNWTKKMYEWISHGEISPSITPDPVFAFNENCAKYIPSKNVICDKFGLPEKYIILSLRNGRSVNPQWSTEFEKECKRHGYLCVALPFPYGFNSLNQVNKKINLPLSPLDWYSIIKYSSGFVGHNMHTIVSALHNNVPCFSFDQYGIRYLMQWCNDESSKIYDILNKAGFNDFRAVSGTVINRIPSPKEVLNKLLKFNQEKCRIFSNNYYEQYKTMMLNIESTFIK